MSSDGKKIARAMYLAKASLMSLGLNEKCASDVSFHLAELKDDLKQLTEFINKAGLGKSLSAGELSTIDELLRCHTHYHYQNFRRALSKAVNKLDNDADAL